jgi:hypothetical protein
VIYRDAITDLEHLRSCRELRSEGLFFDLDAYRLHCFLEFRDVVEDEDHSWGELAAQLGGRGVRSIDDALGQLRAAAVLEPLRRLLSVETLEQLASSEEREEAAMKFLEAARSEIAALLEGARLMVGDETTTNAVRVEGRILSELETVFELARLAADTEPERGGENGWMTTLRDSLGDPVGWATVLTWVVARNLGRIGDSEDLELTAGELYADWHMRSTLVDIVMALGQSEHDGRRAADTVGLMIEFTASRSKADGLAGMGPALTEMVASDAGQVYLRANEHRGVLWFHREAFEELLLWVMLAWIAEDVVEDAERAPANVAATADVWQTLLAAADASSFRLVGFFETLRAANDFVKAGD